MSKRVDRFSTRAKTWSAILAAGLALAAVGPRGAATDHALEIGGIASGPLIGFTRGDTQGTAPSTTLNISLRPQAMGEAFFSWLGGALDGRSPTRNGRIVTYDGRIASGIVQFTDAAVAKVDFPGLDVASSDEAIVGIALSSTSVESKPGDATLRPALLSKRAPVVTRATFRLVIEGVDCSQVATIGAITVSTGLPPPVPTGSPAGLETSSAGRPVSGEVHVSPLVLEIETSTEPSFQKWFAGGKQNVKTGSLAFLASDQKPRYTVLFRKLSIAKISSAATKGATHSRARVEIVVGGVGIVSNAGVVR